MSEFIPVNDNAMEKTLNEEAPAIAVEDTVVPPLSADRKKKKKKSGFSIFRAALNIIRKKPEEKEAKKAAADSDGNWKKIVGSMRPLHMQETPDSPMYQSSPMHHFSPLHHHSPLADEFTVPMSPAASSSCGTMSQYASALNLRDLDNTDEEEGDPDEVFDAITGDEMIDAKADEFIAQFYRQIQEQNSARYHIGDGRI